MNISNIPLVIFTTGGLAKDVYQILKEGSNKTNRKFNFLGFVSYQKSDINTIVIDQQKVITSDSEFKEFLKDYETLAVVIAVADPKIKKMIFSNLKHERNLIFPNIIHDKVIMSSDLVNIGKGNIIAANVVLTHGINIGDFNLINVSVTIGHDSTIQDFTSINPQASVSGNVFIDSGCLIGTNSTILQNIKISRDVIVGAGSVVTKNISENLTVIGVPAKEIKRS